MFIGIAAFVICAIICAIAVNYVKSIRAEGRIYSRYQAVDYASRSPQQKAILNRARQEFGPETNLWP